ncbi:MAG: M20/M25/M40 family metallo-hydrolase [Kiritimatiellae bacterium]|nr:M20/M25/M40 family metallo-hydrolase [Kiritimatiellia bacterium]
MAGLNERHERWLRDYIETPSITNTGNEAQMRLLGEYFRAKGWQTGVIESPTYKGLGNFVAWLDPAHEAVQRGAHLVIAAHGDTVPPPAPSTWQNGDPMKLVLRDGHYYGLGVADTKGPTVAAMIAATEGLQATRLKRPVAFWINHSEENQAGGIPLKGAGEMVDLALREQTKIDAMIVVEPTRDVPVNAHFGYAQVAVDLKGKAAHGSMPQQGDNAVERMGAAIEALRRLRQELAQQHGLPLNIGFAHGGNEGQVNVVPDSARLVLDYRCPPNSVPAPRVLELVRQAVAPMKAKTDLVFPAIEPFACGASKPLVRLVSQITRKTPQTVRYYTDAAAYRRLQERGQLTDGLLVFGCGDIRRAHAPDERIEAAHLVKGIETFRKIFEAYCT